MDKDGNSIHEYIVQHVVCTYMYAFNYVCVSASCGQASEHINIVFLVYCPNRDLHGPLFYSSILDLTSIRSQVKNWLCNLLI